MAKLTFVLEDGQEIVVPISDHLTVGRSEDNDVVVDDERVSKHHAELVSNADGSIQLFDSSSTAGTFVNGERVHSRTMRPGDRLAFGPLTAVFDLAALSTHGSLSTPSPGPSGTETQAVTLDLPVKAGKLVTRNRRRRARQDSASPGHANHQEAAALLEAEKTRLLSEVDAIRTELNGLQQQSAAERAGHLAHMESLRAEEEHLAGVKAAIPEAEVTHGDWIKSIQDLTARHQEQTAALQRLAQDESTARHELESLAQHRDQALAHLQQIRTSSAHDEQVLNDLRHQISELETRSRETSDIATVRHDQVKAAEKKIEQLSHQRAQLEARIHELSGTEEKLSQARARCHEAEAQQAALTAAIAALGRDHERSTAAVKDLEARIISAQQSHQQAVKAAEEARSTQQRTEDSLRQIREEHGSREKELVAETRKLEQARTLRTELEQQCQALADTGQKLALAQSQLTTAEQQLAEVGSSLKTAEAQITTQRSALMKLTAEEEAAKGRLEALQARENDLRTELSHLSAAERDQRTRFEEIRQLVSEAEAEHASQHQRLTASLEAARSDLAALLSRLQPLRDWQEAMDQLYARLATLPQDSTEARDLWHEIEKEKAGLHALIITARSQALAIEPEHRLAADTSPVAQTTPLQPSRPDAVPSSGTAQETTLRSRLSHLRESVQREESRLEQLRRERMRHEAPLRSSPAAEAMLREQARHLETKVRQDQERHHALQRSIETSQAEEDKRRERLAELEHRLAELRTDIIEAERQRSELRQQTDLAHAELKNFEAAIDRISKKTAD